MELAALITARLALTPTAPAMTTAPPGRTLAFDYEAFYREACAAWERFLFGMG